MKSWFIKQWKYFSGSILVIAVIIIGGGLFFQQNMTYERFNSENQQYSKGKIISITKQQLEKDPVDAKRFLGLQTASIQVLEGDLQGKTVEVDNYLSTDHNILLRENQTILLCVDAPEGIEPYITVYNYDRTPGIYIMVILLFLVMIVVGRGKGFKSAVGLFFTFMMIICFMMPLIYQGYDPIMLCMITVVLTTAVSLILLNGCTTKTMVAVVSTSIGTLITAVFFLLSSGLLHLTGFNVGEAESLQLIAQNTGMQIRELLFVGILISSLGAVMDVAMSLTSALFEIIEMKPDIKPKEIITSGMNIGKDMIGTMSNTLILAFTGGALTTILVLFSYGVEYNQLLSSDYIAVELAQGISGTIAIILTVPVTALACSFIHKKNL